MRSRLVCVLTSGFILVLLAIVPSAMANAPKATTLEKVSSLVQPGMVYLETSYSGLVYDPTIGAYVGGNQSPQSFSAVAGGCSGFFVNPDGYFASAGHCVEYDPAIKQPIIAQAAEWSFQNEAWPEGWTLGMAKSYAARYWKVRSAESPGRARPDRHVNAAYGVDVGGLPVGRALPARLIGHRSFTKGDVALLKIEAEDVPVLKLAPGSTVDVGTEVVAVGYPASVDVVTDVTFEASFKDGSVSSHKTTGGGLVGAYEISAPVSKGMSGGPTVDLQGRVVGVNSFYPKGETQPFNFVSPVAEVAQLMRDKGVENRLGRTNALYLAGLRAYYAGDREVALAKLDAVLGQVPEHEFAQEFRAKALRLPKESSGSGFPIALLAIGLAGVAALAGAVAFGLRRRGGPSAPARAPQASSPRPPRPMAPRQDPAADAGDGERQRAWALGRAGRDRRPARR